MGNHLHLDVAITGATGLIGSALTAFLRGEGHRVRALVRDRARMGREDVFWDPSRGEIDAAALEGVDAVVHLAGEGIGEGRWTDARKERILKSRVDGTRLMASTLAKLQRKPSVLVSASALGVYGNAGDKWLDESSPHGRGFLVDVVEAWERGADAARDANIRVVHPRTGIVLARDGGALPKMVTPFKLGAGGRMGDGTQYMSWITLDDEVAAIVFAIRNDGMSGPVNLATPNPVTNKEFTDMLGKVLHRPSLVPAPAFALKLALGEMAEPLLLDSARLKPKKLIDAGFVFKHPTLEEALRATLEAP